MPKGARTMCVSIWLQPGIKPVLDSHSRLYPSDKSGQESDAILKRISDRFGECLILNESSSSSRLRLVCFNMVRQRDGSSVGRAADF